MQSCGLGVLLRTAETTEITGDVLVASSYWTNCGVAIVSPTQLSAVAFCWECGFETTVGGKHNTQLCPAEMTDHNSQGCPQEIWDHHNLHLLWESRPCCVGDSAKQRVVKSDEYNQYFDIKNRLFPGWFSRSNGHE